MIKEELDKMYKLISHPKDFNINLNGSEYLEVKCKKDINLYTFIKMENFGKAVADISGYSSDIVVPIIEEFNNISKDNIISVKLKRIK
jgi:hypothetical protein